jgi:hypothetical protein
MSYTHMAKQKTYYSAQILGRDGRWETRLNSTSVAKARHEADRLASLGWDVRVATESTGKIVAR